MAKPVTKRIRKLSREWVKRTRADFRGFLDETKFPDPKREEGSRGPEWKYPEWLIMFIAILSVKDRRKSYVAIHKMTTEYWDIIAEGMKLKPISERKHQKLLKERKYTVEPMQGLVKDIFDLDRSWMRGNKNNRWLFAAMGLCVQMHQLQAYRQTINLER